MRQSQRPLTSNSESIGLFSKTEELLLLDLPIRDFRSIEEDAKETKSSPPCSACGQETTHGKPYCLLHLSLMPLVQGIQECLRRRQEEVEKVKRTKRVPKDSLILDDVRNSSRNAFEVHKMAAHLDLPQEVLVVYLKHLRRKKVLDVWWDGVEATVVET